MGRKWHVGNFEETGENVLTYCTAASYDYIRVEQQEREELIHPPHDEIMPIAYLPRRLPNLSRLD